MANEDKKDFNAMLYLSLIHILCIRDSTYIGDLTNGKLTQLDLDEHEFVNFQGVWDKQVMYMTIKEENDNAKGVLMSLSEDGKENKVLLDNMSTLNAFLYEGSIYSNDNQQIKRCV